MASNNAAAKFFDALNEGYDAIIDAIRAANDRGHRVSTALIEDAQRGQREAVELATKWADSPFDFAGLSSSVIDATTKAQGRSLEVARLWFGEMTEVQTESREVIQRIAIANRSAGEAAVGMVRGLAGRAGDAAQVLGRPTPAPPADGRRTTRESAESSA